MHLVTCPRCRSPRCEAYGHELLCPKCFYNQRHLPESEGGGLSRLISMDGQPDAADPDPKWSEGLVRLGDQVEHLQEADLDPEWVENFGSQRNEEEEEDEI